MIWYEWRAETRDHFGDIVRQMDEKKLLDLRPAVDPPESLGVGEWTYSIIGLVRLSVSEKTGFGDTEWAYITGITDGSKLPETFDGGSKIPKRFINEFEKNKHWASLYGNIFEKINEENLKEYYEARRKGNESHWK